MVPGDFSSTGGAAAHHEEVVGTDEMGPSTHGVDYLTLARHSATDRDENTSKSGFSLATRTHLARRQWVRRRGDVWTLERPCRRCRCLFHPTEESLRRGSPHWWYCASCYRWHHRVLLRNYLTVA